MQHKLIYYSLTTFTSSDGSWPPVTSSFLLNSRHRQFHIELQDVSVLSINQNGRKLVASACNSYRSFYSVRTSSYFALNLPVASEKPCNLMISWLH